MSPVTPSDSRALVSFSRESRRRSRRRRHLVACRPPRPPGKQSPHPSILLLSFAGCRRCAFLTVSFDFPLNRRSCALPPSIFRQQEEEQESHLPRAGKSSCSGVSAFVCTHKHCTRVKNIALWVMYICIYVVIQWDLLIICAITS